MPADSDAALPRTLRPLGIRLVGITGGVLLFVCFAAFWFAIPDSVREDFEIIQKTTALLFGAGIFACFLSLVRSRVDVTAQGLVVVNGFRTHTLAWAQVVSISMPPGAPWATLDLADGTTRSVMALQAADGRRAQEGVRFIRERL